MRWLLLLLIVLNIFYYVWYQQQAPLRSNAPASLALYQDAQQNIQLLSEAGAMPPRRAPEPSVPAPEQEQAVCLFLGGFEREEAASVVEQRLLSLDIQSGVQAVSAAGGTDYWVYLPPLASRQASLRQLRELQARRIDSYIITQGDLANGISLGIFARTDSAESVMQRLREAGYEPRLRELTRSQRNFWVRIAPQSRRLVDEALLQRLAVDFIGLQHQLMPCESIATPG